MRRTRSVKVAAALTALIAFSGCSSSDDKSTTTTPPVDTNPAPATPDPASVKANEAGNVPILVFRDVVAANPGAGNITAADLKKDLQWLYDKNYRPVSMADFAKGTVDCPAGKMPVILTFDGSTPGQYRVDANGNVDPNCAAAILEGFNKAHDDWPLVGAFFIDAQAAIAKNDFGSTNAADYKMEHLSQDGFDLGVALPANTGSLPNAAISKDLATALTPLNLASKNGVPGVAVPSGQYPKDASVIQSGSTPVTILQPDTDPRTFHGGGHPKAHKVTQAQTYTFKFAVIGGDQASVSPASPKFDAYHIQRIAVSSAHPLEASLKSIKDPFVSDGDPTTIAAPVAQKANIDNDRMEMSGLKVKTY